MSNPEHKPTAESRVQVEAYAMVGLPIKMIGDMIGLADKTVAKHYEVELKVGKAKATAQVCKTLFSKAVKGDVACLIFWLKAQAGWREVQHIEVTDTEQAAANDTSRALLLTRLNNMRKNGVTAVQPKPAKPAKTVSKTRH